MTMTNRRLYLMLIIAALFLAASYALRTASGGLALPFVDAILGPGEPPVPDVLPPAERWNSGAGGFRRTRRIT
jgi:hypothetical protein